MSRFSFLEEREPLAFAVKPQPGEAFDGWINRIAKRHHVPVPALFRHLRCNPALAQCDLVLGRRRVPPELLPDFDGLIDQLCWSVGTNIDAISATYVGARAEWLLPPALRHFGCAQCWLEDAQRGLPLFIRREWLPRSSWFCTRHKLLFADLGKADHLAEQSRQFWLQNQVATASRKSEQLALNSVFMAVSVVAAAAMLDGDVSACDPLIVAYCERFGANQLHFSGQRIAMLAACHIDKNDAADQFCRTFGLNSTKTSSGFEQFEATPGNLAKAILDIGYRRMDERVSRLADVEQRLAKAMSRLLHHKSWPLFLAMKKLPDPQASLRSRAQALQSLAWRLRAAMRDFEKIKASKIRRAQVGDLQTRLNAEIAQIRDPEAIAAAGFAQAAGLLASAGWHVDRIEEGDAWGMVSPEAGLRERLETLFKRPLIQMKIGWPNHDVGVHFERPYTRRYAPDD